MFIAVIILLPNFKTASLVFALVSIIIGVIPDSIEYSKIASILSLLTNQYIEFVFSLSHNL